MMYGSSSTSTLPPVAVALISSALAGTMSDSIASTALLALSRAARAALDMAPPMSFAESAPSRL
jgi:hypothetical protein